MMALALGVMLAPPTAFAVDSGDIVVVSMKGEVHVTMNGTARAVRAGSVLELPATLRTGRDGTVDLKQGATTLSVGPETLLEFPALEKRGAPIDRIVQPRGNVFYNIGKRDGRRLRIETPYLVGVVKGTQFNVTAADDATTISLFEGLLEVRAADDSGFVDLKAGEIASRQRDDHAISVLKMGAGRDAPPAPPRKPAGSGSNGSAPGPSPTRPAPARHDRDSILVDRGVAETLTSLAVSLAVGGGVTNVEPATGPSGVEVAAPQVVSPASVDAGAAVSVSAPVIEVSTSTNVDAGPASVDAAAAVSVSAPVVDVSTSTSVDASPVAADVGSTNSVDVGAGTVDTGATAELETGDTRFTVINGSSRNQVEVTVGSANAAEAVAGNNGHGNPGPNLDLGVDLGVDLDVDLGLDDESLSTPPADTTDPTTDTPGRGPPADVVELLDGLVRRPGKK